MGGDPSLETRVIEVGEEEREAEHVETTDYFFNKIGESVPLTPNNSFFDLQNPPSFPLAISERFRLTFVTISDGFCVAKTADVINLAKDIKSGRADASSSVLDVSFVQVLIGRVSILSLSSDSSTLAASVGGDIRFFSVKSLLAKEKEPCLLLSIESSNYVKHISWTKKRDTSFVVLSNTGTLYSGDLKQPLKHVMDDVNTVEWSVKGEFLAVARNQFLSIFTQEFNERKRILLEFKLGSADEGTFIVDSIQWVRLDCIVVGSLQQTVVGNEENYMVQVIMCKNGQDITDASSRPEILSLSDLFLNIVDDIMPFGHGPHLLLSYLETRQLAVLANRKNTDQHIALVGWLDDSNGPAVIHIERDNCLPRIELQENGDDNVLLAMCIDRASVYENIEVKIGEDDQRELSPYCIFLCLTHEGKLVLFHFASISGNSGAPTAAPAPSDEETISTSGAPDLPTISVEQKDDKIKEVVLDHQSHDMDGFKSAAAKVDQKSLQRNTVASHSDKSSTSMPDIDQTLTRERVTGMLTLTSKNHFEPSPVVNVDKILGGGQSGPKGNEYLKQIPLKSFAADASKVNAENLTDGEKPRLVGLRSASDYSAGINFPISDNQSHGEQLKNSVDLDKRLGGGQSGLIGNEFLKQVPLKSFAGNAPKTDAENFSKADNLKLVGRSASDFPVGKGLPISNLSHGEKSKNSMELGSREPRSNQPTIFRDVVEQGTANLSGSFSSSGAMATDSRRATSVPTNASMGIHSTQVPGSLLPGKTVSYVHPVNVKPKSPSPSTLPNFEMSLSKKYGNMKDMTSELDKLLQCIEEPGGFTDTCTGSQKLLENLEETTADLFHKCTKWQSLHHEQGESIQHLLDYTVQVLARRIYMEGIVKQTRDMHYWDLWNRQKLSSELQMRRQSMINLSQDLINQLIELEKHFNTIELNNYGESSGVNLGYQSFRNKYAPSRQIQSLHAVQNSLNSQLAAAEQLSDCLSRQMSALSITSSSVKPDNVKDQLFKRIGISSESHSGISSPKQKGINTDTPHVTPVFSSVATTIGNDIRSYRTGINNPEPETARRRRDSFDQNWANFETSKTTIKRVQRGNECADVQRTSLFMDKRFSIASDAERSVDAGHATHLDLFHDARVAEDTSKKFLPRSSSKSPRDRGFHEPSPSSVNHAFVKQIIDKRSLGALSPDSSKYSGNLDLHVKKETHQVMAERPDLERTSTEIPESVFLKERKTGFIFAQSSQDQPNIQRAESLVSPFSKISNVPMSYNNNDSTSSKHPGNIVEQKVSSSPSVSGSLYETESSQIPSTDQPAIFSQLTNPTNRVQSSEALNTSSTANPPVLFSSVVDSAVNSPFSSSSTPTGQKFFSTGAAGSLSTVSNKETFKSASKPTNLAFLSASSATSQNSLSSAPSIEKAPSANLVVKPLDIEHQSSGDKVHVGSTPSDISSFNPVASSPMTFTINSTFETPNTVPQPSSASKDNAGFLQKELPTSELNWNSSTFTNSSGSHLRSSTSATHGSDAVASNSETKKSSGVFLFPQATQVSAPEAKTTTTTITADSDVAQEEDEMEEEVPDTTNPATAGLGLGSLGGLGLGGSGPSTSSAFGSNPFGGGAMSAAIVSSPSTDMTIPSGQLFRPASFSFPSLQPSQQQPRTQNTGGFMNLGTTNKLTPSVGQPAQMGSGQQALGSVLGSFGQSRQLGPALPGNNNNLDGGGFGGVGPSGGGFLNAASGSGFSGGGFATAPSSGGFAGLSATGSGFTGGFATAAGGFAGAGVTGGGGFGNLSTSGGGGGFSAAATGGGFAGAAGGGGGGFGAFSNQGSGGGGGGGAFSSFGGGLGGKQPPPQLFTQIRK